MKRFELSLGGETSALTLKALGEMPFCVNSWLAVVRNCVTSGLAPLVVAGDDVDELDQPPRLTEAAVPRPIAAKRKASEERRGGPPARGEVDL